MDGRPSATEASIRDIRSTAAFIEGSLLAALEVSDDSPRRDALSAAAAKTATELNALANWLENDLDRSLGDAYGEALYARKLALAYGSHMTPEVLERIAMTEIETVRGLMEGLARSFWEVNAAADFNEIIQPILAEMEGHRASNQQEFLQEFLDLIDRSRQFLEDNDLVDLPEHETLFTALSPIQLPSYFVGFRVFDEAYERERARLGDAYSLKAVNNAVVDSGGIPMGMLEEYLGEALGGV